MPDPRNADGEPEKTLDELEERMREVEERAANLRASQELPEVPEWSYKRPEHVKKSLEPERGALGDRQASYGLAIAYTLIGALFGPWAIGWLIDRQMGTGQQAQAIAFMIGMVAALVMVTVMVRKMNGRD